jgi:hypothetical protein
VRTTTVLSKKILQKIGIQSEGSDIEIRKIIYDLAEMECRSPYPRELHGCHVRAAVVFGAPVVMRSYVLCFVSETIWTAG